MVALRPHQRDLHHVNNLLKKKKRLNTAVGEVVFFSFFFLILTFTPTPSTLYMPVYMPVIPVFIQQYLGVSFDHHKTASLLPSTGIQTSILRSSIWYKNNMHPLCTPVHTNRGPTPRNHPPMPSCL